MSTTGSALCFAWLCFAWLCITSGAASWAADPSDRDVVLIHGDQDPQMPINQAHELYGKYQSTGGPAEFDVIYGGGHGGSEFYSPVMLGRVGKFLRARLGMDKE